MFGLLGSTNRAVKEVRAGPFGPRFLFGPRVRYAVGRIFGRLKGEGDSMACTAISGHTHLVSLFGRPVQHSLSPALHTASFARLGIDAVYLCLETDAEGLPAAVDAMRRLDGWDGGNVTMPCKQAIIPLLDALSEGARLMGAVNVIEKHEGRLIGHNTDGAGFTANLRKHGVEVQGVRIVLLGPGGAGSAVLVQAALEGAASIEVFAREGGPSYTRATTLLPEVAAATGCELRLHAFEDARAMRRAITEADLLVNATSVGMGAGCTQSPVPAEFLQDVRTVADVIYFPQVTQLMVDAQAAGCQVVGGLGMMAEQAALGERIWYGVDARMDDFLSEILGA